VQDHRRLKAVGGIQAVDVRNGKRATAAGMGARKHDDGGRDRPPFVGSRLRSGSAVSAMPFRALTPAVLETVEEAAALSALAGAP
jgi:hypothetical protein